MGKIEPKPYPLNQSPLFNLKSRKKLAESVFNVNLATLERLAGNGNNFRVFELLQNGKARQVEVPKVVLERFHRRVFTLLARIEKPDYLHSGRKGRSYVTNAGAHIGSVPLVKLDLKKFYPSVDGARVARFLSEGLRCSADVAGLLTRLCVYENHIPTGSCVSQLLAYFAISPMLDELSELAASQQIRMTCYVDDLTFSGAGVGPAFLWSVKQIVHRHGFKYHKERCYRPDDEKIVTGVMIRGDVLTMIASRELELARDISSLSGMDMRERLLAIERLIGKAVAGSQIDVRFLSRIRRLKWERSQARAELDRNAKIVDLKQKAGAVRVPLGESAPW